MSVEYKSSFAREVRRLLPEFQSWFQDRCKKINSIDDHSIQLWASFSFFRMAFPLFLHLQFHQARRRIFLEGDHLRLFLLDSHRFLATSPNFNAPSQSRLQLLGVSDRVLDRPRESEFFAVIAFCHRMVIVCEVSRHLPSNSFFFSLESQIPQKQEYQHEQCQHRSIGLGLSLWRLDCIVLDTWQWWHER